MDNAKGQVSLRRKMEIVGVTFELAAVATGDEGLATTTTVTVEIEGGNSRPVATNTAAPRSVAEEAAVGTSVLPGVAFTDEDPTDAHTITIVAASPLPQGLDHFAVDSSGALTAASPLLNFEFDGRTYGNL